MTDLKDLARRVSELQGPSREIDAEIARALGWREIPNPTAAGGLVGRWYDPDGNMSGHSGPPDWLASLDAAMTLVPEGAKLTFQNHGDTGGRSMWLVSPNERFISAATPALALCAAALIARSEA